MLVRRMMFPKCEGCVPELTLWFVYRFCLLVSSLRRWVLACVQVFLLWGILYSTCNCILNFDYNAKRWPEQWMCRSVFKVCHLRLCIEILVRLITRKLLFLEFELHSYSKHFPSSKQFATTPTHTKAWYGHSLWFMQFADHGRTLMRRIFLTTKVFLITVWQRWYFILIKFI